MENDKRMRLFQETPIPRAFLALSIPTIISSLIMVAYNMADTYFVSLLGNAVQNAAVTLASPVLLAFNAINNLFGVGGSSMMSRALGRKDYATVRKSSAFSFYLAIFSGVLFSIGCTVFKAPLLALLGADPATAEATAQYLFWTVTVGAVPSILNVVFAYMVRSEGASLHASIGTMSGCVLNMILDPIFILPWGLNMGAAGAGLATMLSNTFACLYFFVLLYRRRGNTFVSISPRNFTFRRPIVRGIFTVGIPAAIQNLLNVTGSMILNNFTSAFGPNAVAAMGIASKVNLVPFQIALGASQGIMPLISYNYASGDSGRMKKAIFFSLKISTGFLAAITILYFTEAGPIIRLFMKQKEIVAYGTRFLRGMCLGLVFIGVDFMAVGVFQATGMGHYALLFAIARKIILEIPLIYLLNYLFPLYGLAYAQTLAELILSFAAFIVLMRLIRRVDANAKNKTPPADGKQAKNEVLSK